MKTETYRGVVRGGIVLLEENGTLSDGTEVVVTPINISPGTAAGVLAAVEAEPHVPAEWVDELERAIASGRRPPTEYDPFADESASSGTP